MSLWARPRPRRRAGSAACTRMCSWSARTAAAASTAGAGIAARTTRITTPIACASWRPWRANLARIPPSLAGKSTMKSTLATWVASARNARRNSANACARNLAISTRSTRPGISTCSASGTTILPISPPRATLGTTRISCSPGARSRMIRTSPLYTGRRKFCTAMCACPWARIPCPLTRWITAA